MLKKQKQMVKEEYEEQQQAILLCAAVVFDILDNNYGDLERYIYFQRLYRVHGGIGGIKRWYTGSY